MQKKDKIQLIAIGLGLLLLVSIYFFNNKEEVKTKNISIPKIKELKEKSKNKLKIYEKEQLEKKKNQKSQIELDFINLKEEKNKFVINKEIEQGKEDLETKKSLSVPLLREEEPIGVKNINREKKGIKKKPKSKTKEELEEEEIQKIRELYENFELQKETHNNKSKEKIDVFAEIARDQTIISGKEISFRLIEELVLENIKIPKNTPIYGISNFSSHRIKVEFSHILFKGQLIPFKRNLYDLDGFEGIGISNNTLLKEIDEHVSEEALEGTQESIDSSFSGLTQKGIKAATGILKKIISKKKSLIEVHLDSGHKVILREKKSM